MSLEMVKKVEGYLKAPELRARLFALAERDTAKMERVLTVAMKALARNEKLQNCSVESIVQAVTDAVEIGLEPSGVTGEAYIIPRKGVACFQPSYRGKAKLAYEHGWDLIVDVIYENDPHRIRGGGKLVKHEYAAGDRGEPLWFYVVATHMATGYRKNFPPMSWQEIKYIRDEWGYDEGDAWKKSPIEMGKKTALHRAEKLLPCSPKMNRARELDTQHFDDSETVRGRVVPANEPAPARVPPDAGSPVTSPTQRAEGSEAGASGGQAAPSPAPVTSRKPRSKVAAAMEASPQTKAALESVCPDCIPAGKNSPRVLCAKHKEPASGPTGPARDDSRSQEPEGAHRAGQLGEEVKNADGPGPCELTPGCTRPDGHPGASAGWCEVVTSDVDLVNEALINGAGKPEQSAIQKIVETAANTGPKTHEPNVQCPKTKGCVLGKNHPVLFCQGPRQPHAGERKGL